MIISDWVVHRRRISKRVADGDFHEAFNGFGLTMDNFLTMQIDVCFIRNLKPTDWGAMCRIFKK